MFPGSIDSKLPAVGTTIFTTMSQLADRHDAINLSQGFPDFQPPSELVELVARALRNGCNQYAPMPGLARLREAVADLLRSKYEVHVDADSEITITSGATAALFAAIQACVRRDDEVIVFDPAYDSYEPAITLAGGKTVHIPLTSPGFSIDWDRLHDALSDRTRLVVINTPHNPAGTLLSRHDLDRLAELLRPYACFLLSDEVYEHIVFDGAKHSSVLSQPELAPRSFAIFSFGKTYHATGWKVGYCVAPAPLMTEFRRVHQFLQFATTTPFQHALAEYIVTHPEHFDELAAFYQTKRDRFRELLADSRFSLLPCHGTYFQLADYGAIADTADVEFSRWLVERARVAVIPISVFCASPEPSQRLVRFCFAKQDETLVSAAERLVSL
jgi:methionine aminotransferase